MITIEKANEMTVEEKVSYLHHRLTAIEEYNAGWKKCQDGSYEMALHNSGYFTILKELQELTKDSK